MARTHPAEHEILFRGHAYGTVAVRLREIGNDPHLSARQITERHRHDRHREAELPLRSDVRLAPSRVLVPRDLQEGRHGWRDPRSPDTLRYDAAGNVADLWRSRQRPVGLLFRRGRVDVEG